MLTQPMKVTVVSARAGNAAATHSAVAASRRRHRGGVEGLVQSCNVMAIHSLSCYGYCFKAPAVTPSMKLRWKTTNSARIGSVATVATAIISGHWY